MLDNWQIVYQVNAKYIQHFLYCPVFKTKRRLLSKAVDFVTGCLYLQSAEAGGWQDMAM